MRQASVHQWQQQQQNGRASEADGGSTEKVAAVLKPNGFLGEKFFRTSNLLIT
jgi:hypothetical protein